MVVIRRAISSHFPIAGESPERTSGGLLLKQLRGKLQIYRPATTEKIQRVLATFTAVAAPLQQNHCTTTTTTPIEL